MVSTVSKLILAGLACGQVFATRPLHDAVEAGNVDKVRSLLNEGCRRNRKNEQGLDAICWAAFHGQVDCMGALLDAGVPVEGTSSNSPLICAATKGHGDTVRLLIDKGANVQAKDEAGVTALQHAAGSGNVDAIAALLDAGANIEAAGGRTQCTPLIIAVLQGHWDAVRVLAEKGANVQAKTPQGIAALQRTAGNGNVDAIAALLDAGANIEEAPGSMQGTPLIYAAVGGHAEAVRFLLEKGANIRAKDANGNEALRFAAELTGEGRADMVRVLLEHGADVDADCSGGSILGTPHAQVTALALAAFKGFDDAARLLIKAGANIDAADSLGWTPLIYAAVGGNPAVIRLLIENGADAAARSNDGKTAAKWVKDLIRTKRSVLNLKVYRDALKALKSADKSSKPSFFKRLGLSK